MTEPADKPPGPAGEGPGGDGPAGEQKPARRGMSRTARLADKRREQKLEAVREQVADGSLTIRQMTPEEREKYPPRPRRKKR